jgi:hypothetical protein
MSCKRGRMRSGRLGGEEEVEEAERDDDVDVDKDR